MSRPKALPTPSPRERHGPGENQQAGSPPRCEKRRRGKSRRPSQPQGEGHDPIDRAVHRKANDDAERFNRHRLVGRRTINHQRHERRWNSVPRHFRESTLLRETPPLAQRLLADAVAARNFRNRSTRPLTLRDNPRLQIIRPRAAEARPRPANPKRRHWRRLCALTPWRAATSFCTAPGLSEVAPENRTGR